MVFHRFLTPHHNYLTNTLSVRCPNCGNAVYKYKLISIEHEKRVIDSSVFILFPTYHTEILKKDGFSWTCEQCKSEFTTGTLDISTRIF